MLKELSKNNNIYFLSGDFAPLFLKVEKDLKTKYSIYLDIVGGI
jgi:hypothetical protein